MSIRWMLALLFVLPCCPIPSHAVDAGNIQAMIESGSIDALRDAIGQGSPVLEQMLPSGMTPLNFAAMQGKTDIVAYLHSIGGRLDSGDNEGSQAMHNAAAGGHLDTIRFLLANGAVLDARDNNGMTPLNFACQRNRFDVVRYLMEQHADVNVKSITGMTPFMSAILAGNPEMAEYLLGHGARWNSATTEGLNSLHLAGQRGLTKVVDQLLGLGMKPDLATPDGVTPLFWAVGPRSLDAAKRLIEAGADVRHVDHRKRTALHFAANRGSVEIIAMLLEKGADIDAADEDGFTPLSLAVSGQLDAARCLILHGASLNPCRCAPSDPKCRCGNGMTPLHFASRHAGLEMVRLLVENGALINVRDHSGRTPLYCAVQTGHADVVRYLLDHGAIPGAQDNELGRSDLHVAASTGRQEIADALLSRGADPDQPDRQGLTPLDQAFSHKFKKLAYDLIARGADDTRLPEQLTEFRSKQTEPTEGQAQVWYLGHSGWAVRTANHLLVFDYAPDSRSPVPDETSLFSGFIVPEQLRDRDVVVFVTHRHIDHYSAACFDWAKTIPRIRFVLGFDPQRPHDAYTVMGPDSDKSMGDIEITTIRSTDEGVAYLVSTDGVTVFHAGDHACGREETKRQYREEIDRLKGRSIDIAFFPVTGCGIGEKGMIREGIAYAVDVLSPALIAPMHAGDQYGEYIEFGRYAAQKAWNCEVQYPVSRGYFFEYGK